MDQVAFEHEMAVNRRAYESLRERIRRDYAGQYVALAQGKIVAGAADYDEAVAAVQRLTPIPEHYLVFPADEGPDFEPFLSYNQGIWPCFAGDRAEMPVGGYPGLKPGWPPAS